MRVIKFFRAAMHAIVTEDQLVELVGFAMLDLQMFKHVSAMKLYVSELPNKNSNSKNSCGHLHQLRR